MPNQESAFAWPFGNGPVRVGTQGFFRLCLKTSVAPFLPTRLTAPGSPEDDFRRKVKKECCFGMCWGKWRRFIHRLTNYGYWSAVITFSGFLEHLIIYYQAYNYKLIEWWFARFYRIKTEVMRRVSTVKFNSINHQEHKYLFCALCKQLETQKIIDPFISQLTVFISACLKPVFEWIVNYAAFTDCLPSKSVRFLH